MSRLLLSAIFSSILFSINVVRAEQPLKYSTAAAAEDSTSSSSPDEEYVPKWYSMFANIPGDWVRFSRETFRSENIPAMAGIAAWTGVLLATDDRTWQASHRLYDTSAFVHHTSDFFEYLGDGRPQFGLAGAFALYGFTMRDRRALRTASQLVEAILSCGAVIQVLKHVTGRQSPYVSTVPGGTWDFFPNQIEYHKHVPSYDAYPSGHIATAMTTLTVIAENYSECWWIRPLGYATLAAIGFSMANTGIHWYSDYPLGLALGYSFGILVAHPILPDHSGLGEQAKSSLSLAPKVDAQGTGIIVGLSF